MENDEKKLNDSDSIECFENYNWISTDDDHAHTDVFALSGVFQAFIQHEVHERIEPPQDAGDMTTTVQFHY